MSEKVRLALSKIPLQTHENDCHDGEDEEKFGLPLALQSSSACVPNHVQISLLLLHVEKIVQLIKRTMSEKYREAKRQRQLTESSTDRASCASSWTLALRLSRLARRLLRRSTSVDDNPRLL